MLLRKIWHKLALGECLLLKWPLLMDEILQVNDFWCCGGGWKRLQGAAISLHCSFLCSLVDDRCVVQPEAGDLNNPPKKFRGKLVRQLLTSFCLGMILGFVQWWVTISDNSPCCSVAYFSVTFFHEMTTQEGKCVC